MKRIAVDMEFVSILQIGGIAGASAVVVSLLVNLAVNAIIRMRDFDIDEFESFFQAQLAGELSELKNSIRNAVHHSILANRNDVQNENVKEDSQNFGVATLRLFIVLKRFDKYGGIRGKNWKSTASAHMEGIGAELNNLHGSEGGVLVIFSVSQKLEHALEEMLHELNVMIMKERRRRRRFFRFDFMI